MFIKAVLDTTVYGPRVHTTFLLKNEDEGQRHNEDGQKWHATTYQHIANCNSEVSAIMHIVFIPVYFDRFLLFYSGNAYIINCLVV